MDAPSAETLQGIEGVRHVKELSPGRFRIGYADAQEVMDRLVEESARCRWRMSELRVEKSSLDNIFAELSKKVKQ